MQLAQPDAPPTWSHSANWGYFPSGAIGIIVIVELILLLTGLCNRCQFLLSARGSFWHSKEVKTDRGRIMRHIAIPFICAALLIAGCNGGIGGSETVVGAGPDDLLKLRAGPGLGFKVIMGLPDGTSLIRRDCVTEAGQLWCRVSLSASPGITGYVSADYLSKH